MSQGTQAPTVAIPSRFPLILQPENRTNSTLKDAKLINGYMERGLREGEYWLFKRPGLRQTGLAQSGLGLGVYNWDGDIYSIFGTTLYRNGAGVGTVNATGGVYKFSSALGGQHRMQLGNGVGSYNYDPINGLVPIVGANFPSDVVKGWAYLDGTTYVLSRSSSIRGCAVINEPQDWSDTLNRISVQIEPDDGVALNKQLVYVIALSQWSTEVFYDQQNPAGSPLGPTQGAKINYGCANTDSVQEMDGLLFWVATNRGAAPQVLMLDNLKPSIVSSAPVERILGEGDLTAVYSFAIKYAGHRFYGFTLLNDNITMVYDVAEKLWAQWTDVNGNYWPIVSNTFSESLGRILQHRSNGKLYTFDSSYTTDDNSLITVDLYTPNFDGGVRTRKQLNRLEVIADQEAGSILNIRHNDFDFAHDKWTNFRNLDLNVEKPMLANEGTFMRRAYHLRHKCNTRLRLQALEMSLDMGTL